MSQKTRTLWSLAAVAAIVIGTFSVAIAGRKNYPSMTAYASGGAAADNAVSQTLASTAPSPAAPSKPTSTPKPTKTADTTVYRRSDDDGGGEGSEDDGSRAVASAPTQPAPVQTAPAQTPSQPAQSSQPSSQALAYKNGTYEAVGNYDSPAGPESIDVTLTISNDAVTSASVSPMANDGTSAYYQQQFISGYKSQVIGQPLDSINLQYVSGSSLTPIGFDNALASIKAKAKA